MNPNIRSSSLYRKSGAENATKTARFHFGAAHSFPYPGFLAVMIWLAASGKAADVKGAGFGADTDSSRASDPYLETSSGAGLFPQKPTLAEMIPAAVVLAGLALTVWFGNGAKPAQSGKKSVAGDS